MESEKRQELSSRIRRRYQMVSAHLSEKGKRAWAASESIIIGRGGDTVVSNATGISRVTISKGKKEIKQGTRSESERVRKKGGGRKSLKESHPEIIEELDIMIDPFTRGDPESPLRWTCKSTYNLANELEEKGYKISQRTVYSLLQEMGYSMQANQKKWRGNKILIVMPNFIS